MKSILCGVSLLMLLPGVAAHAQATRADPSVSPPGQRALGVPKDRMGLPQARAGYANRTRLNLTTSHGPQVTYTSADGKTYLWYPGNQVILSGEWKVELREARRQTTGDMVQLPVICFKYGANTYNPATGSRGAVWECVLAEDSLGRSKESEAGDPFGLSKRAQPPFVLTRDLTTFREIKARMRETRL
jgi:hypothetical protein